MSPCQRYQADGGWRSNPYRITATSVAHQDKPCTTIKAPHGTHLSTSGALASMRLKTLLSSYGTRVGYRLAVSSGEYNVHFFLPWSWATCPSPHIAFVLTQGIFTTAGVTDITTVALHLQAAWSTDKNTCTTPDLPRW